MNKQIRWIIIAAVLQILFLSACMGKQEIVFEENYSLETDSETVYSEAESQEQELTVHVCGAVKNAGVYVLPSGSRLHDAVTAAGGFAEDAAKDFQNLAMLVTDGSKVFIPTIQEAESLKGQEQDGVQTAEAGKININTADVALLCTLTGIGQTRAKSIVAYREKNGNFRTIEDIMKVEGIKEGSFEKLKDQITVDG